LELTQYVDYHLHEYILALWGMPLGEMLDLEKLAAKCRERNRWFFFFSSAPANCPGMLIPSPEDMGGANILCLQVVSAHMSTAMPYYDLTLETICWSDSGFCGTDSYSWLFEYIYYC
jgi:hypothetical protein